MSPGKDSTVSTYMLSSVGRSPQWASMCHHQWGGVHSEHLRSLTGGEEGAWGTLGRSLYPREALDQGSVLGVLVKENHKAIGLAPWPQKMLPAHKKSPSCQPPAPHTTKPTPKTHPFWIFQWHRILSSSNRELSLQHWWPTSTVSYSNAMKKEGRIKFATTKKISEQGRADYGNRIWNTTSRGLSFQSAPFCPRPYPCH